MVARSTRQQLDATGGSCVRRGDHVSGEPRVVQDMQQLR